MYVCLNCRFTYIPTYQVQLQEYAKYRINHTPHLHRIILIRVWYVTKENHSQSS